MATEVILPVLGETVNECTIVEWYKGEGEPVRRGEPLFSVESDKAVLDVEAVAEGFLRKILVPAGTKVPVLTVVALIARTAGEALGDVQAPPAPVLAAERPEPILKPASPQAEPGRPFASPRARRAAREAGIDLAQLAGSGPDGRIVERDVLGFLAERPAELPAGRGVKATPLAAKAAQVLGVDLSEIGGSGVRGRILKADVEAVAGRHAPETTSEAVPAVSPAAASESVPVTGLRRIVAERMAASHRATARVTLVTEADATLLVEAREKLRAAVEGEWGFAPGFNDLLAICVARALIEFPYMNARLSPDGQAIERMPSVNLGMAVDTNRGLLVPVIRNAGEKGLRAFGTEFRALVERARAGRAQPDDLVGGTFTITNLGMFGVDAFTPIINLPECAILGVGRIRPAPAVVDGQVAIRQRMWLSLTFDHRLVDGGPAARFLQAIVRYVETPSLLLT